MLYLEDKVAKIVDIVSKVLPKDGQIGVFDDDCDYFYGDYESKIYRALEKIDPFVEVNHGMSKMVIISSLIDYVIKIPLTGIWVQSCDENGDYIDDDYWFDEFAYGGGENGDDYCAEEVNIYETVLEEHPEYTFIFPETMFYKQIDGVKYYLQEKCKCGGGCLKEDSSEIAVSTGDEICTDRDHQYAPIQSLPWCIALVENYGVEMAKEVLKYLHQIQISDLHNGNIGYNKEGKPIILDFSGFDS